MFNLIDYHKFRHNSCIKISVLSTRFGLKKIFSMYRLRPDIRKLEQGDMHGAASEKTRLEEKQRETRKARKSKKDNEWIPR